MSCGSSNWLRAAAVALACIAAAPIARAAGVFAQPASLYLTADAGSNIDEEISLSPTSDSTTVSIALSPFTIDEHGRPQTCECALDRTIRSWGDVSEHRLTLTAGRRDPIALHLSVPTGAGGSYWGAVMIEVEASRRQGARVRSLVAVPVFVTVRGTESARVEIGSLKAFRASDGRIVVDGMVTNRSKTLVRAPLAIAIESGPASAPVEIASTDAMLIVLPDGRRVFRLTLSRRFGGASDLRATAWLRPAPGSAAAEASCPVDSTPPCDVAGCRGT